MARGKVFNVVLATDRVKDTGGAVAFPVTFNSELVDSGATQESRTGPKVRLGRALLEHFCRHVPAHHVDFERVTNLAYGWV